MTPGTSETASPCRLALIGDHPWARAVVEAVQRRGGCLCVCAGPASLTTWAVRWAPQVIVSDDAAFVLSQPEVDLVILADAWPFRAQLLLQAVQLDRSVLVVHPADRNLEVYYVVQLALEERRFPVWPIMPHRFFEGLMQLRSSLRHLGEANDWQLEVSIPVTGHGQTTVFANECSDPSEYSQPHPFWWWADWLRLLGGEVAEVYAVGERPSLDSPHTPLTVTGRWERGGHFVWRLAPGLGEGFRLQTPTGSITWRGATIHPGTYHCQFQLANRCTSYESSGRSVWDVYADWLLRGTAGVGQPPRWSDAVAAAELVHAVEDSLRTRKAVSLLHQEYTESSVFKSQAATIGCGTVWLILVLAMISPLVPQALYLIPVLLAVCLALFVAGWLALRR
ncbi:MAG: hypothetical protein NZM42_09125 [Gemmatales bacterium]|nr:hypothetical protein [Gemmatales bacterium]MDW8223255.1 hypothetical protein [Gemmatales bacterium]